MGNNLGKKLRETDPLVVDEKSGRGPLGKGDPEDETLRSYEIQVHIPALMNKISQRRKCRELDDANTHCFHTKQISSVMECARIRAERNSCIEVYMEDDIFKQECIAEYLRLRSEYRKTGRRKLIRAMRGEVYAAPPEQD